MPPRCLFQALCCLLLTLPSFVCPRRTSVSEVPFAHGRHLSAVACGDVVIDDDVFKGIIVDDKIWRKARRNLQRIFDCVPERGVLALNTTEAIVPRGTIFIEQPITVTTLASQVAKQTEEIPEGGLESLRIEVRCPKDRAGSETLFDIRASNVIMDSLTIQGCTEVGLDEAIIYIDGQISLRNIVIKDVQRPKATPKTAPVISIRGKSVVSISSSSFIGNQGGVLRVGEEATISIAAVSFSGNQFGKGKAGAIHMEAGGTVALSDVNFFENVGKEAGAVYIVDSDVSAERTEFKLNKGASGGGVHMEAKDAAVVFTCQSCSFDQNSASRYGGGVFMTGHFKDGDISFKETKFNQDSAGVAGGALHWNGTGKIEIEATSFSGCEGVKRGGCIDLTVQNGTIDATLLDVNITESQSERGGGLHLDGKVHVATIGKVLFSKNVAKELGGAILLKEGASLSGSGVAFSGNSAEQGGAIFALQTISSDGKNLTIDISLGEATFSENAAASGGALELSGGAVVARFRSKTSFSGNKASERGGAMSVTSGARVILHTTDFFSNLAGLSGGSIALDSFNRDVPVVLNATDVQVVGSSVESAEGDGRDGGIGGGMSIAGFASVKMERVAFSENKAKRLGGAIFAQGAGSDPKFVDISLELSQGAFIENLSGDGGALALSGAVNCLLTAPTNATLSFTKNRATSGAAVYARDARQVTMARVKFIENLATGGPGGGAIRLEGKDRKSTVSLSAAEFTQNEIQGNSSLGGGLYASGAVELTLDEAQFSGNLAGNQGSAMKLVDGAELSLENVRFAGMCSPGGL